MPSLRSCIQVLYRYASSKVQITAAREQANFEKRFKWAFIPGYSEATTWDEDRPILGRWRRWRNEQEVGQIGCDLPLLQLADQIKRPYDLAPQ